MEAVLIGRSKGEGNSDAIPAFSGDTQDECLLLPPGEAIMFLYKFFNLMSLVRVSLTTFQESRGVNSCRDKGGRVESIC